MGTNAFCKVEGIDGDSTIEGFEKQIEVIRWNHNVTQPVSVASGRGALTVASTNHSEFQIVKEMDMASPKLLLHASNGKHIPKVEVTLCRAAGDKPVQYMKYELEDVIVSSYHPVSDETGDGLPEEIVGFSYGKIKATYKATDTTGKETGSVAAEVDLRKGKTQ
jgi:type VI secretion system secreted protein Hcp